MHYDSFDAPKAALQIPLRFFFQIAFRLGV